MDQLLWAPIFLSTIVAAQFTLEVCSAFPDCLEMPAGLIAATWSQSHSVSSGFSTSDCSACETKMAASSEQLHERDVHCMHFANLHRTSA